MADYVLIDWEDHTVSELNPTDPIEAYIQGVQAGKSGHDITLEQVNVSPPVQRYPKEEPKPEPEPSLEPIHGQSAPEAMSA